MIDKEIEIKMAKLDELLKESDKGKVYTKKDLLNSGCFDHVSELKVFFLKIDDYYVSPLTWVYDNQIVEENIAKAKAQNIK